MGGGGVRRPALAAIDIALWDLVAKEVSKPLVAVLGPCRERILAYASGINLNKPLDELLDQVRGWKASGFKAYKIKVGKPDIAEDVERLTKVREIVGAAPADGRRQPGLGHRACGRARSTPMRRSIRTGSRSRCCATTSRAMRGCAGSCAAPIAIGENVYTIQQFNHYLARGACDFVQADVVRVGGITPYLDIAALARAWNVPLAPHFMMEISAARCSARCRTPTSSRTSTAAR